MQQLRIVGMYTCNTTYLCNTVTIHMAGVCRHSVLCPLQADSTHTSLASQQPGVVRGYGVVNTPAFTPGPEQSPLMTWGDIGSTPIRLDQEDDIHVNASGGEYTTSKVACTGRNYALHLWLLLFWHCDRLFCLLGMPSMTVGTHDTQAALLLMLAASTTYSAVCSRDNKAMHS